MLAVTVAVAATGSLWWQRRWPVLVLGAALGALVVVATLTGFDGPDDPFIVLLLWASFGVGRYAAIRHQPWAAAATLVFLSLNLLSEEALSLPAEIVFPVLIVAAPWLLGLALQVAHARTHEVLEARDADVQQATDHERLRLARELHDVAAHHMSAVSLQAQVLRRRADAGGSVSADDLRSVEAATREAMTELRRVLGVLRPPGDANTLAPQPDIDGLPALVTTCRDAGHVVDLIVSGDPRPLPAGLSVSAYRIVQEALTNARRHGLPRAARAEIEWRSEALRLLVTNPVAPDSPTPVCGNGIAGMRERVALFGGTIVAGPDGAGSWLVDVILPVAR